MFRFFRKKKPADPGREIPAAEPASDDAGNAQDDQLAFERADALQNGPALDAGRHPPTGDEAIEVEAPVVDVAPPWQPIEALAPERESWMARLRQGLRKTGTSLSSLFGDATIDDDLYDNLEAALLMADAGVPATAAILDDVKDRVRQLRLTNAASVKQLLVESIADLLTPLEGPLDIGGPHSAASVSSASPTVIMVAGVNGAGKTTSIGKLTRHLALADCKVLLAAADTFRAAAKEQLAVWADRTQVQIVSQEGGDPAAVAFDAVVAGKARGCDVVIVDTAGRLATQAHLMDELRKIRRTLAKAQAGAPHEVLLVVDGNTGQNAVAQARAFDDAVELTGLIVTKLDGTARGGVLAAIALWAQGRAKVAPQRRPIKVYFVGVGESLDDLERFSAFEYARALLE